MKKTIIMLLCATSLLFVGCKDKQEKELSDKAPKGVEKVDLGLPSGLKWASMNVGATTPDGYGDYFAWGEIKSKKIYNWNTYKWCKQSYDKITKYCCISDDFGTIDNKAILDKEDDAAYINWGGDWRTPTEAEQRELMTHCSWIWTNDFNSTGIKGYIVKSKTNENFIFLPAAGFRLEADVVNVGSFGHYWSSSLYKEYPTYSEVYCVFASLLSFDSGKYSTNYNNRRDGHSIRAVCK